MSRMDVDDAPCIHPGQDPKTWTPAQFTAELSKLGKPRALPFGSGTDSVPRLTLSVLLMYLDPGISSRCKAAGCDAIRTASHIKPMGDLKTFENHHECLQDSLPMEGFIFATRDARRNNGKKLIRTKWFEFSCVAVGPSTLVHATLRPTKLGKTNEPAIALRLVKQDQTQPWRPQIAFLSTDGPYYYLLKQQGYNGPWQSLVACGIELKPAESDAKLESAVSSCGSERHHFHCVICNVCEHGMSLSKSALDIAP